jgi:hypothetical protein
MEDRSLDKQVAAALGYETLEAEDSAFGPALYIHDVTATRDGTNHRVIGASWERLKVNGIVAEYCVRLCPAWSTNIAAAWELIEQHPHYVSLTRSNDNGRFGFKDRMTWKCRFYAPQSFEVEADTAPVAICLAALKALV